MLAKIGTKLAVFLLKHADLNLKERNVLTAVILDKLSAIPLRGIIDINEEGTLLVKGRPLDIEQARTLRESAKSALVNRALQLIMEGVYYHSFVVSTINAKSDSDLLFGKAAIWWCQQVDNLLKTLIGGEVLPLSED